MLIILISSLIGSIVGLALIAAKKHYHHQTPIPFGPFLAGAGLVMFLYGEPIMRFYWKFVGI